MTRIRRDTFQRLMHSIGKCEGMKRSIPICKLITYVKPHFYDLLLTDIDMPNMNGFQLCQKLIGIR